jgi:MutS domain V
MHASASTEGRDVPLTAEPITRVSDTPSPRTEYVRRLADRRALAAERERTHAVTGISRFAVAVVGVVLLLMVFALGWLAPGWLAVPVVVFLVLSYWHQRVTRALNRARRAIIYYERGIARLDGHWQSFGDAGDRYLDDRHPNARDLDLFGKESLYQLLCTARTRSGKDLLASWLLAPAAPEEVKARQAAVAELSSYLDLREDLALLGADVPAGVDLAGLAEWGEAPPILVSPVLRVVAFLLAALAVGTVVYLIVVFARMATEVGMPEAASWAGGPGLLPVIGAAVLELGFALWLHTRVRRVLTPLERRAHDLAVFHGILARLEQEQFHAPRLVKLRAALQTTGKAPSERIEHLLSLLELLDSKRNLYFAPFGALMLWTTQLAFALEAWRRATGPAIRGWLEAVAQFEALGALGTYSAENPEDPFPDVVEEGPVYDGEGLGHPLLPGKVCVRNDVRLGGELRVLVVSGSNMSGKSTLLRTVGVNAVLALAGAPVRARRLRVSPLTAGATLRVQDSLQGGVSRFMAEVQRVRQLVELARGPRPLLFLLDELFAGTNSHDRRLGAEAVIRTLVESGAIGLITTHDLALTHITDLLGGRATNVHFEDNFEEGGGVTFDYHMRPGVVERSNALALMRSVGLEV